MTDRIGMGGGCHWCTEAVFQALCGVARVEQGFIRSHAPADAWSEAVIVHFDPALVDMATLIEVYLRTHASTRDHAMRGKYRSAVYAFTRGQARQATGIIDALNPSFGGKLVTAVMPFVAFRPSDARFADYYATDPERPFCKRYIDPKLDLIRQRFGAHVRPA